ncbi:hypothetical protein [Nocardia sp. NBC_00416]|uniref:hypothetical protein n=1 Tax=Nocardia sp. NBC_00416 TaxID=2975991 RepID=UPI002E24CBC2
MVFVPFHYGYRDLPHATGLRAANELTRTEVDPASKQPLFNSSRPDMPSRAGLTSATEQPNHCPQFRRPPG